MFCKKVSILGGVIFLSMISFGLYSTDKITKSDSEADQLLRNWIMSAKASIQKKVLANGLTVIFYPIKHSPEVSIKVGVDFGTRDEQPGQYGFAHMIEHMVLKGTPSISEVDINRIVEKFGVTDDNAFTYYDKTEFVFFTDNKNWLVFIGILADLMQNAKFDENHFNSEVKAVLSEINLGRKNVNSLTLAQYLPFNHPYIHPILGKREDLLNATAADLKKLYQENYTPGNMTLFIVGDINQSELFVEVDRLFGSMPAKQNSPKKNYCADEFISPIFIQKDVTARTQLDGWLVDLLWFIPGIQDVKASLASDAMCCFLTERLKKMQEGYGLVGFSRVINKQFPEFGQFIIKFNPIERTLGGMSCVETVKAIILNEIHDLAYNGPKPEELSNFKTLQKNNFASLVEYPRDISEILSSNYNINKNEFEFFDRFEMSQKLTSGEIKSFCKTYLKPNMVNQLNVTPLEESEKDEWNELQNTIDQYEKKLVGNKNRETKLDDQRLISSLPEPKEIDFIYEKPDIETALDNGLKVYIKQKTTSPNVLIGLFFKNAVYLNLYYLSRQKGEILEYAINLMGEETQGDENHPEKFTSKENSEFFNSFGAEFDIYNRTVSCLPCYIEKVTDKFLNIITNPTYPIEIFNRDVNSHINQIKYSDENLDYILHNSLDLYLFEKYPWMRSEEQKIEELRQMTRQDLLTFHKQWFAPQNMFLVVVGNIDPETVLSQLKGVFGVWKNDEALNIEELKDKVKVEDISNKPSKEIIKKHQSDQVTLIVQRVSTYRDTDDALVLNVLFKNVKRKIFEIRERTGLFYGCDVSLSAEFLTKGSILIKTQISPENAELTKNEIKMVLKNFSESGITQVELDDLKRELKISLVKSFSSVRGLFLSYQDLIANNQSFDYYYDGLRRLNALTLEQVNFVAKQYFNPDEMSFAIGGRIS